MHEIFKNQSYKQDHVLIAVSAKEEGKVFELKNGAMQELEHVTEHPPTPSDNEGFFQRSGNGVTMGSGSVQEEDDHHNITAYLTSFAETLSQKMADTAPRAVLIVEPEHLKDKLLPYITNPEHVPVVHVRAGNFVQSPHDQIQDMVAQWYEHSEDPEHPASVAGEENAEEKRKILEVAQMRADA